MQRHKVTEMPPGDSYKTIKSHSSGYYKEKGSRFISEAWPVKEEHEIKTIIAETRKKYHDAKHHCYAYLLDTEREVWRANDDGEPSGTAGRPILGQIRSSGVTNVLIIVTRYFGGTLLGTGGLTNAYKKAAAAALENAQIIDHIIHESYEIKYPYAAMSSVMKIISEEDINQSEHSFDLECRIIISFRASAGKRLINRISRIEGLTYRLLSSG